MSDHLTELLHERTDDLPVFVRGASGLRQAAETARRKRRQAAAVTAVATVVALILGAGAVLTGSGGNRAIPPPAVDSSSPTLGTTDAGLLRPQDLPSGVPFGAWTGATDLADPTDGPFCVPEISAAGATSWQLRRFASDTDGVAGYQVTLEFGTLDQARHASGVMTDLASCGPAPNTFEFASDGRGAMAQNGRGVTDGGKVVSLVWSRSQQFVSVLELSWHSAVLLVNQVQEDLWKTVRSRLDTATEGVGRPPASVGQRAMLAPDDVTGLPADAGKVSQVYADPYTYWPMHTCDYRVAEDAPMREAILGAGHLGVVAAERLVVLDEVDAARTAMSQLMEHIAACDDPSAVPIDGPVTSGGTPSEITGAGDEAAGYTYDRANSDTDHDVVRVAVLRFGRVLVQVVRIQDGSASTVGPAAFQDLVAAAAERVDTHLDEVTAGL